MRLEPVTLAGRFVVLEPLVESHAADLAAAAGGDRSTYTFTAVPQGTRAALDYIREALAKPDHLPFAVRRTQDGIVVGTTRFLDTQLLLGDVTPTVTEIGATWYAATAQRTPVNTEAKLLLLTHAFETWRVQRVSLKTDSRNDRSRAAIERIGARFDGVLRRHSPAADGGLRDAAFYSIIAEEWPDARRRLEERLGRTS